MKLYINAEFQNCSCTIYNCIAQISTFTIWNFGKNHKE